MGYPLSVFNKKLYSHVQREEAREGKRGEQEKRKMWKEKQRVKRRECEREGERERERAREREKMRESVQHNSFCMGPLLLALAALLGLQLPNVGRLPKTTHGTCVLNQQNST